MATGIGIKSKAAFRLNKPDLNVDLSPTTNGAVVTVYPTSVAVAAAGAQRMGPYDLLPLLSETFTENYDFDDDMTLIGKAGIGGHDAVSKAINGSIELQGTYLGLDNILAATFGMCKTEYDQYPQYNESQSGDDPMTGTTSAGSTATTLQDDNVSQFVAGNIGEWVRIADSGDATEGQVRRITARADADNMTITPAWTSNPGAGSDYQIARGFFSQYECATNMHVVTHDSLTPLYSTESSGNSSDVRLNFGTLCFDKTVGIWEYRGVMVNSLTFNYNIKSGLTLTADLIAYDLDLSSSVNTASTTWDYCEGPTTPIHLQERIMGADLTFRLDDWSNGTALSSADNLPISDFTLTINNNLKVDDQTTVSGLYIAEPHRSGFREITGTITVPRYTSNTSLTDYQADTLLMASAVFEGSTLTGSGVGLKNTLKLWLHALKITNHNEPIAGPDAITQTFNFKCFYPSTTSKDFPTLINSKSEISCQTANNYPFNPFRAQNAE